MSIQTSTNDLLLSDERKIRERGEYTRTLKRMGCDVGYASRYIITPDEWNEMVTKDGGRWSRIRARRAAEFASFMRGEAV